MRPGPVTALHSGSSTSLVWPRPLIPSPSRRQRHRGGGAPILPWPGRCLGRDRVRSGDAGRRALACEVCSIARKCTSGGALRCVAVTAGFLTRARAPSAPSPTSSPKRPPMTPIRSDSPARGWSPTATSGQWAGSAEWATGSRPFRAPSLSLSQGWQSWSTPPE